VERREAPFVLQPAEQHRFADIGDDADMSTFWNAAVERIAFWRRAMSVGAWWMWDVLDKTARIFAVLALVAVSVGGVLLHQPAAVIGGVLGVLAVLSFAEGTYRVARDVEQQRAAADSDADALWLSEQLSAGNKLLARWHAGTPSYNAAEQIREAAEWEHETQGRLAERLPQYAGHFGVEVGLGREFAQYALEPGERVRLRRRIHRLKEIADRYEHRRAA
jgi:hypothetical protein